VKRGMRATRKENALSYKLPLSSIVLKRGATNVAHLTIRTHLGGLTVFMGRPGRASELRTPNDGESPLRYTATLAANARAVTFFYRSLTTTRVMSSSWGASPRKVCKVSMMTFWMASADSAAQLRMIWRRRSRPNISRSGLQVS